MEGKPAWQKHDLDRHDRHPAPRQRAEQRQKRARENIRVRRSAMREDRRAGAPHMVRLGGIASRLQREIGLDAAADIEGAIGEQWPAVMRRLFAPEISGDLGFEPGIGRLAEIMLKENIFRRNRNIRLQLEDEMPILALRVQQRLRCPGNRRFDVGEGRDRLGGAFH